MPPAILPALHAAALGLGAPPAGARRLVRLDLPPLADLRQAPRWLVLNPANGRWAEAPVEVAGEGFRMWHAPARLIALDPGLPAWVAPC